MPGGAAHAVHLLDRGSRSNTGWIERGVQGQEVEVVTSV